MSSIIAISSKFLVMGFILSLSFGRSAQLWAMEPGEPPQEATVNQPESPMEPDSRKVNDDILNQSKQVGSKVLQAFDSARQNRSERSQSLMGTYSLIDTWIPSKYGVSYAFHPSSDGAWEIEYLRGTVAIPFFIDDLGQITDQRISLFYRSYSARNSFSFHYGVNYSSFKAKLGNSFLSTVSGGNISQYDLISIQTLGVNWGLGNRWQFKNRFVVGLDWFSIYIPLKTLESNADFLQASAGEAQKNEIRDALDVIEKIPTFALLKLQLGISF